jgi:hypothetical protein
MGPEHHVDLDVRAAVGKAAFVGAALVECSGGGDREGSWNGIGSGTGQVLDY